MILLTDFESILNIQLFRYFISQGVSFRLIIRDKSKVPPELIDKIDFVEGLFHSANWDASHFLNVETIIYPAFQGKTAYDQEMKMLGVAKHFKVKNLVRFEELNLHNFDGKNWKSSPIEDEIESFGFNNTLIRTNMLMQSILPFAPDVIGRKSIQTCSDNKAISFVDVGDIATGILTVIGKNLWGKKFIFTGDAALTYTEVANTIGALLNEKISYVNIPKQVLLNTLHGYLLPNHQIDIVDQTIEFIYAGFAGYISKDLQQLGIKPTKLAEFLKRSESVFKKPA